MKTKHYYVFDSGIQIKMNERNLNKRNWDILRQDEKKSPFSIEKDISSYEENCKNSLDYKKQQK